MALGHNIRDLRKQRGWTLDELAQRSGVDIGTIGALEARDSTRSKYARPLAFALNVSLDVLLGDAASIPQVRDADPRRYAVDRPMSLDSATIAPIIKWESLMQEPLPPRFEVTVPDDSMAPRVRSGQTVTLSSTDEPRPGDGVLVADSRNRVYLRVYRQRRADAWEAHPLNEAYQAMDSERDGLRILAIVVGAPERWG